MWPGSGPRQALLSMALDGVDVLPLTDTRGRAAGELLARTRGKDVIAAALVLLAVDGDEILTSDVGDLTPLARASGLHVALIET